MDLSRSAFFSFRMRAVIDEGGVLDERMLWRTVPPIYPVAPVKKTCFPDMFARFNGIEV